MKRKSGAAPGIATAPLNSISDTDVALARQNALQAVTAAYTPIHSVKLDGEFVSMCWFGRIDNAFSVLEFIKAQPDAAAKAESVAKLIETMRQDSQDAFNAATKAQSDYAAIALAAGKTPENLDTPQCQCDGCRNANSRQQYWLAVEALRKIVFSLIIPQDKDRPLLAIAETDDILIILGKAREAIENVEKTAKFAAIPLDWTTIYK